MTELCTHTTCEMYRKEGRQQVRDEIAQFLVRWDISLPSYVETTNDLISFLMGMSKAEGVEEIKEMLKSASKSIGGKYI